MANPLVTASPAFHRALPFVREQLVPAYAHLSDLAFAYCQGSMVEGLSDNSDVDIIFVWRDRVPDEHVRPPLRPDPEPRQRVWPRQETFHAAGQEYGVAHYLKREWDDWMAALEEGRGCDGWPTPVIAAHGLLTGLLVHDPTGAGKALQARLLRFPARLRTEPGVRARGAVPDYLTNLEAAARVNDSLLFHGELVSALRLLWIGWFSAREIYWPLEKRLTTRLRRLGREDLASMEEGLWKAGPELAAKLAAFRTLSDKLLSEVPR